MICNCIKEITERVKGELATANPAYAHLKITGAQFENEALLFNSPQSIQINYPITLTHEPVGRKKTTRINMLGEYCPFCGKYIKEAPPCQN